MRFSRANASPGEVRRLSRGDDPVLDRLIERINFGATLREYELAYSLGYDGYLAYQLDYTSIDDTAVEALIASRCPTINLTSAGLWAWSDVTVNSQLEEATILRAILSPRGLFERVVEFWRDHFNIFSGKPGSWNLYPVDLRNVLRANALTTFPLLLAASSKSPAMLNYLDNQLSTAGNANENYARELLELHTLGADNGYTQQDVIEVARCLTGWGYHPFGSQPTSGTFRFDPAVHDNGAKTVMGLSIPANGGITDGETVVSMLAAHKLTARTIVTKLARRFLGDPVPDGAIDLATEVWNQKGGDITAVLETLLDRRFMEAAAPRYKRPFHLFASALKTLPVTFSIYGLYNLIARFSAAGNLPFSFSPPNGPPDSDASWHGLQVPRWNTFGELMAGVVWDTSIDLNTFFAGTVTPIDVIDRIDVQVFQKKLDPQDRADILAYLSQGTLNSTRKAEALSLALSSPSFSTC